MKASIYQQIQERMIECREREARRQQVTYRDVEERQARLRMG